MDIRETASLKKPGNNDRLPGPYITISLISNIECKI
jgi:hypothetical protein